MLEPMFFYAKSWRPDKAYPNPPLLPGDTAFGHFHRPRVHSTYDVRFHMSPLQAFYSHLLID